MCTPTHGTCTSRTLAARHHNEYAYGLACSLLHSGTVATYLLRQRSHARVMCETLRRLEVEALLGDEASESIAVPTTSDGGML